MGIDKTTGRGQRADAHPFTRKELTEDERQRSGEVVTARRGVTLGQPERE